MRAKTRPEALSDARIEHNVRVGPTPKPLAAQRLLFAGLVALALLSALLLWSLRASAGRERGTGSAPGRAQEQGAALAAPGPTLAVQPASASAAGRADERAALRSTPTAAVPAEESFDPGAIRGRVLCAGVPVAEVELWLFEGALERQERKTPLATTKSDERGRFRMRGLEPHVRYVLQAQHRDYLPVDEAIFPGHEQELELERAASVSGTVRSLASQAPRAGVEVALERWHFEPSGMRARVSATSDAEGRWQLPWAAPGIQTFAVLRAGYLPERREFQVAPEGGTGFTILLAEERALELELFALESGALLADCELSCDEKPVRTDARGRLVLPLSPGASEATVRVSLALAGGCLTQGRVEPGSLRAAGGLLRLPLARGGTVRGRVLDAAGQPVSAAELRLSGGGRVPAGLALPAGFWLSSARIPARSAADGSFELGGLPPREGPVELRARHPAYPPGRSERFSFARLGETVELEVRLERGATLSGSVRLDGEPAALRVYWEGEHASGGTRANDRGAYRIVGVPSGALRLGARLEDEDDDSERPEDLLLSVAEGDSLTADLELHSQLARIRGRVLDTRGEPVAEAEVLAFVRDSEEDWEAPSTESKADGSFELAVPDTPGLVFVVVAERGPQRAQAESVTAGARELVLVVPALASVAVRVVDALRHEPVQGFQLYWRAAEEGSFERLVLESRSLFPGADGTFLAELPAGHLDLLVSARAQGYVPARREGVNLLGARPPTLEFELERGVELELEFELTPVGPPAGLPEGSAGALLQLRRGKTSIASAEQWAERERGGAYFQQEVRNAQALRPDANGVARLAALPSGRYRFFNAPKGFVFRPEEFELPPVAQHRVKVALEPERKKKGGGGNY